MMQKLWLSLFVLSFLVSHAQTPDKTLAAIDKKNYPSYKKIEVLDSLLAVYQASNNYRGKVACLSNLILAHDDKGDYLKCTQLLVELEELIPPDSTKDYLNFRLQKGNVLLALERFEEAEALYSNILKDLDTRVYISQYHDLLSQRAISYAYLGRIEESIRDFRLSSKVPAEHDKDGGIIINAYSNLSTIYGRLNQPDSCAYYSRITLKLAKKHNQVQDIAFAYDNLAGAYALEQNFKMGLVYLDSALLITNRLHDADLGLNLLSNKAKLLSNSGQYEEAYHVMDSVYQLSYQMFNQELATSIAEVQERYEAEKKARIITQLETESLNTQLEKEIASKQRNLSLGLAGLFLLGGLGFYLRFVTVRKKNLVIAAEKQRSEELLLNILPYDVAEELKEYGKSEAKQFDQVTILFTDFINFTQESNHLSPGDLVEEINTCFMAFDHIVERHGIEKIKTIGDAYMAAGGLPTPTPEAAVHVVRAALEMRNFIQERAATRKAQGLPAFAMRLGIHTGPVVAGIVGIKKFQYDLWGDTVNTAARMEQHSEAGKINISETTASALPITQFSLTSRGTTAVKGKGDMHMYFVETLQ